MERPNKKTLTVKEFIQVYPEKAYLFDIQNMIHKRNSRGEYIYYIKCNCDDCGKYMELVKSNAAQDYRRDGKIRCKSCSAIISNMNMSKEVRIKAVCKANESRGKEGRLAAWSKAQPKVYEACKNNGTFMRSKLELQIEQEFGGQHSAPGFKYELDCYWPELHKGIEVDDPTHYEGKSKPQGYHKTKDDYFKSLGIEVLHITFNSRANRRVDGTWRDLVESFLNGTYNGPLIDLEDPIYGDIIYS